MVASSSNLLLVAAATAQGHVRTGSTIPNDHDLTMTNFSTENRRGYMIRSTSTNNISGISGTNLKDMIMLETVAPAYASAPSALASVTAPSAAPKEEGKQASGPRPRRKKMVSTGVDTMKKMLVTDSSVVVALPESSPPTVMVASRKHERAGEQRDDIDSVFNNIRVTTNRKVLDFDLSVPAMPDMMLSMPAPAPALPTPDVNRNSKLTNEMSNNSAAPPPMKKKKNHMGRRLLQMKKRLTYKSKAGSNKQVEVEKGHLSHGTSATTSTSSFGLPSEEEGDVPFMDEMMTMEMTTTLKPRIRSMFHDEMEDMLMMPVLPAPPCPLSTPTADVAVTTPSSSFCSKLDKALSVLSPSDGDEDDAVTDDDAGDEWGVFASDDDEEEEDHHDDHQHNYNFKTKASSRSSFTKHTINPCFAPRAHLPVFATAGAE